MYNAILKQCECIVEKSKSLQITQWLALYIKYACLLTSCLYCETLDLFRFLHAIITNVFWYCDIIHCKQNKKLKLEKSTYFFIAIMIRKNTEGSNISTHVADKHFSW